MFKKSEGEEVLIISPPTFTFRQPVSSNKNSTTNDKST